MNDLSLKELREEWSRTWGHKPHGTMGRKMLLESLKFRHKEQESGGLKPEQQDRLNTLIRSYKRNPDTFDKSANLKPGTRLVRIYEGQSHSVLVKADGFEYNKQTYRSLSKIANVITGSRWNGWLFFGAKR
jgi:hypothetical protein